MITKISHRKLKPKKAVKKNMTHMTGATTSPIQNSLASALPPKLVANESKVDEPSLDSNTQWDSPLSLI